jgi:hypothetical protein
MTVYLATLHDSELDTREVLGVFSCPGEAERACRAFRGPEFDLTVEPYEVNRLTTDMTPGFHTLRH